MTKELRIIYMGTPEFAVEPLRAILEAGYKVPAVVTAADKPAGRGQKLHISKVKEFALKNNIEVLQPLSLKQPEFLARLKSYNANLQVVVAFRMLPEVVWQMPDLGTLNLHASLLPQYRGAAPINHAIINGETETGLTTFFITKEIDTGHIILTRKLPILPSDDAGSLHDRLMNAGGIMMVDTLKLIETGKVNPQSQDSFIIEGNKLNPAPKIFKKDCKINWDEPCVKIHNLVRGLSPFPGAFTYITDEKGEIRQLKIFRTSCRIEDSSGIPGSIITDSKNTLSVKTSDGLIYIEELQLEGKKRMSTTEFLRGMPINNDYRLS